MPKPKPTKPPQRSELIGWWRVGTRGYTSRFVVCLASDGGYYAWSTGSAMSWHGSWNLSRDGKTIEITERVRSYDEPGSACPWPVEIQRERGKIVGRNGWVLESLWKGW